jgi:histidyl-tRNA synthetase
LEIDFEENPRLVRGLDYYMHTVWEVTHPALGAQDAVAGGGRYRVAMGSREIDGVGFALGMERLITCLQQRGVEAAEQGRPHVWVVSQSARAFTENLLLAMTLRRHGVACGIDLEGRSMKAQMRAAGKAGVAWVIIRGDREMDEGLFLVKDMEQGTQEELEMPDLMKRVLPQLQAERI